MSKPTVYFNATSPCRGIVLVARSLGIDIEVNWICCNDQYFMYSIFIMISDKTSRPLHFRKHEPRIFEAKSTA